MSTLVYEKVHKDGSVELLSPHAYGGGKYRVEIEVEDLAAVESAARKGARVRMSGPRTKSPSIVPVTRGL